MVLLPLASEDRSYSGHTSYHNAYSHLGHGQNGTVEGAIREVRRNAALENQNNARKVNGDDSVACLVTSCFKGLSVVERENIP